MSDKPARFADIFSEDDDLGLLAGKAAGPTRSTEDDIVISQFEAVNAFFDQHGFLPGNTENGRAPALQEYSLEGNLETFRATESYRTLLAPFDRHGFLGPPAQVTPIPSSIDEILASDDALLSTPADAIFDLKQ